MDLKPELFRIILIWVKNNLPNEKNEIYTSKDIAISPYNQQENNLHVELLIEGGFS
jgi:hypothetical protein